jgi:hypothetical protein
MGRSGAYQQEMFVKALKLLGGLNRYGSSSDCVLMETEVGDYYNSLDDQIGTQY